MATTIILDPQSEARLHAKCIADDIGDCVLWIGAKNHGYGQWTVGGDTGKVHRIAYEHWRGPIPPGLVLDHLCRVRSCVNPWHLRIVTRQENTLAPGSLAPAKANADKDRCPNDHEYTHRDPDGKRRCRTCRAADENRRYHAGRAS